MKSKKNLLAERIKSIVEHEVNRQIKKHLREHVLLSKKEYNQLMEIVERSNSDHMLKQETTGDVDPFAAARHALEEARQQPTQKPQKKFTGNSMIDKILNETRGGINAEYASAVGSAMTISDYPDLMGKTLGTDDVHTVAMQTNKAQLPIQTAGLETGRPLNINTEQGKSVAKALTRNYSDVLKKVKEKKGF